MRITEFLRRLFCWHRRHRRVFVRNIHGDEIRYWSRRSWHINHSLWACARCGKLIPEPEAVEGVVTSRGLVIPEVQHK